MGRVKLLARAYHSLKGNPRSLPQSAGATLRAGTNNSRDLKHMVERVKATSSSQPETLQNAFPILVLTGESSQPKSSKCLLSWVVSAVTHRWSWPSPSGGQCYRTLRQTAPWLSSSRDGWGRHASPESFVHRSHKDPALTLLLSR